MRNERERFETSGLKFVIIMYATTNNVILRKATGETDEIKFVGEDKGEVSIVKKVKVKLRIRTAIHCKSELRKDRNLGIVNEICFDWNLFDIIVLDSL